MKRKILKSMKIEKKKKARLSSKVVKMLKASRLASEQELARCILSALIYYRET